MKTTIKSISLVVLVSSLGALLLSFAIIFTYNNFIKTPDSKTYVIGFNVDKVKGDAIQLDELEPFEIEHKPEMIIIIVRKDDQPDSMQKRLKEIFANTRVTKNISKHQPVLWTDVEYIKE